MKKTISLFLAAILTLFAAVPAISAEAVQTKLYNVYGDSMLFQQNEPATLCGTAKSGSKISCELIDSSGIILKSSETTAKEDGTFAVSFDAPAGGYDEYVIRMYQDGVLFDSLEEVVFGELWLASGQSNMHIFLRFSKVGTDMVQKGETGSKNIRILDMPLIPGYNSDPNHVGVPGEDSSGGGFPLLPQKDIEGAEWFKGDSQKIYDVTALGYFFAEQLQKDLDMPVGILCDYLGGSGIDPWLSREAIESDSAVKKDMGKSYISAKKWDENGDYNNMVTMSVLYNKKTAPLTNFRIAGMIWYQGESDCGSKYGTYSRAFNLLQKQLTKDFNYKGSSLPIVYTTFADHNLGGLDNFRKLGAELGDFASGDFSSRAVVTISDLPLGYTQATQTVHPWEKKPVGVRMAISAEGLVYGKYTHSPSSPTLKSSEIKDESVYLTFYNTCDGLMCDGKTLHGFSVCGKRGVYVPAQAEIVSKDTVRVFSDDVKNPVAAMYSMGQITARSNLFSSVNGEKYMPVCHTISDRNYVDNIWQDCGWTDCDQKQIWHQETLEYADFFDIWNSDKCSISIDSSAAYSGDAGINIRAEAGSFGINPVTSALNPFEGSTSLFCNWNENWKNYSQISLMLKNNGSKDCMFDGVRIYVSDSKYYMPCLCGSRETGTTVPADGQWHRYSFDLDSLYLNGRVSPFTLTRLSLKDVCNVHFCFSSDADANLCFDSVQIAPYKYAVSLFRFFGFDIITFFSSLFIK